MDLISATTFAVDYNLPDWRFMLGRLEATFRLDSYPGATGFAAAIADAAERAQHHPDLEIRYPGDLHITLETHAAGGVTDRDTALAGAISELAAEAGAESDPTRASTQEIAIDAFDIGAVRPFWLAVLDYAANPADDPGATVIVDPRRTGPVYWFQQMDTPRTERNNIHIDVTVPHDVAEQRIADAIAAGGHLVSDRRAKAFWILADAEGNEACICTCQDRD